MTGTKLWLTGSLWATLAAGGCATVGTSGAAPRRHDIRGTTHLMAAESRLAIAGPVHLLHLDYRGSDPLELLAVERREGAAPCDGPVRARTSLHANRPNVLDFDVGPQEAICLSASATLQREVAVSWHAVGGDAAIVVAAGAPTSPSARR